MFCDKCGNELPNNASFCPKCGAKVIIAQAAGEKEQVNKSVKTINDEKVAVPEQHKRNAIAGTVLGVIAVIMVVALAFMRMGNGKSVDLNIVNTAAEPNATNLQLFDVTVDEIDVYAENRQPNTRDFSLQWDKTLFYTLEDIAPEDIDGQIEKYDISQKELLNAKNGNQISYEIYTNPETEKINKIVSIENLGDVLEITDYYYLDDGQPNFIYQRTDSIYTPTYATPNKTGERYYFNNDTLVRWRWINVPLQVEEISLGGDAESSAQTQYLFNEIDAGKQEEFNKKEIQMLNAAYNTYAAMEKSSNYANIKGYVLDTTGSTLKGATIAFYAGEKVIGSVVTDENGYYETGISLYNAGYNLVISCDGYADATIYGVVVDKANITNWMGNVYLTPKVKQKCSVKLNVYDADTISYNDDESVTKNGVAEASVIVRTGVNNTTGKSVAEQICDSAGNVTLDLNVGIYTIEISMDGYISSYETLVVDAEKTLDIPLIKEVSGNQMKVVLSWDGNADLDSCLFTPYKADDGDMAHINAINNTDSYGNALLADSKDGHVAEVITIADCTNGTYKYYVSDYNNCLNGNFTATDMQNSNVRVTIYDKNGIVATYTLPYNQSGVIWEVFEVKNGKVVTLQKSYSNVEGKNWWSEDKSVVKKNKEALEAYYNVLVNGAKTMECHNAWSGDYEEFKYAIIDEIDIDRGYGYTKFVLCDLDGDNIQEMIFGDVYLNKDVSECLSGMYGFVAAILKYDGAGVTIPIYDYLDAHDGLSVLNNGMLCRTYEYHDATWATTGISIYENLERSLSREWCVNLSIQSYYQEDMTDIKYYEFYIDDNMVTKEEWEDAYQKNVVNYIFSEEQVYDLTFNNLKEILLEQ